MSLESVLKEHNQEQVLAFFDELSEVERETLTKQVEALDWAVIENLDSAPAISSEGEKIEPIEAVSIEDIEKNKAIYKEAGLKAIREGKVAAVLLAGGMGTRLGFDGPKGSYNVGITKDIYIFECLINNLKKVTEEAGCSLPFCIMTSEKNDEATRAFFEEHNYFGYDREMVNFFVQDMAPAVSFDGKLLLEEKGRLATSPNGNGGWYSSLHTAGLAKALKEKGVKWINIFGVDNVLQQIADPVFIGATILSQKVSGSKVLKKCEPEERMGLLCKRDGKPGIIEYYELPSELANMRDEDGELTYRWGVILNYLFSVDALDEIVGVGLPMHIVKKKVPYINEQGVLVKPEAENAYKFEALVLDMIALLSDTLAYEVIREQEFAPIKNLTGTDSVESARELLKGVGVEL